MGWCSGTPIFDGVVRELIRLEEKEQISEAVRNKIATVLANAMRDHDWDCERDTMYYKVPWVADILGFEIEEDYEDD